ncbi:glycerate kinase [Phycicoccus sp. Root563]|uniref:glycerate kinase n=1 Tax=Phycicoccus sp. Root563 TaxID=1736562 RepID=UPI0007037EFD|nr:glycerate kinase [Phycicoccus sp. Root563]KQZ89503.1 glycerate kinase [Phycicoccus sp. Root563]
MTVPTSAPRVVIAPDKFKGTLTAAAVATNVAAGLRSVLPDVEVVMVPVADGGDGTLAAAEAAGFERVTVPAHGPTGEDRKASYGARGSEAVVELAEVCGLDLLAERGLAPLTATSRGTGDLISAALDDGARRVVVGIGGSASTDGGLGLLQALGARVTGADGREVGPGGLGLEDAVALDLSGLHPGLAGAEVVVACDVDNPLTGSHGAAAVYGPQKGASPDDVERLDAALTRWADLVAATTGADHRDDPGAGAAGGVGFGLVAVAGATTRPGADLVFELAGFHDALVAATLVITGEGAMDRQTLHGKAPAAVAAAAREAGVPVVAVAGKVLLTEGDLRAAGIGAAYALVEEGSEQEAFDAPGPLLERLGARIAREHLGGAR